jgi:hypothetical protein
MVNATNVLENLFNGEGMAFEYKPSVSKQVQAYESGSIESETPYLSGRQQTIARGGRLGARAAAQQWEEENPGQTAPLSISDPEEFQRIINRYNAPNSGAAKGTQPMSGAGRGGRGGRGGGGQISPMEAELYYQDYIKKALAKDPFGSRGANPRSVVEEFLIKNREKEQANLYNEYKKELDSLTSGRGTPGTWEPRMANTGINF